MLVLYKAKKRTSSRVNDTGTWYAWSDILSIGYKANSKKHAIQLSEKLNIESHNRYEKLKEVMK